MIPIETERLHIQEATLADAHFIYELLNSPTWLEHIGDRGITSMFDAEAYIENSLLASYREHGFGLWKVSVKDTNAPLGICGFLKRDYLDAPDIGFAQLPQFEGFGYMLEAASVVMDYGKNTLGLTQILAVTTEGNERSKKLLTRLDLEQIGAVKPHDKGVPFLLFSNQVQ